MLYIRNIKEPDGYTVMQKCGVSHSDSSVSDFLFHFLPHIDIKSPENVKLQFNIFLSTFKGNIATMAALMKFHC